MEEDARTCRIGSANKGDQGETVIAFLNERSFALYLLPETIESDAVSMFQVGFKGGQSEALSFG